MSGLESTHGKAAVVAANLAVDAAGARARSWLADEQIECVLLKGRGIAERLYDQPWERPYSDVDLLIQLKDRERAERVLIAHGYRRLDRDGDRLGAPAYAHTFVGSDQSLIDLHWNLSGVRAAPSSTWAALSKRTTWLTVANRPARVPSDAAMALIVTLHNAHHGARWRSSQPDLERALTRLDQRDWMAAVELADQLDAREAFTAGLRLSPGGRALADGIGVGEAISLEYQLRAGEMTFGAWAWHRVLTADSPRARARAARDALFPPAGSMRVFFPLARRGTAGLIAAYLLRLLRLTVRAPRGAAEYVRARAAARQ
jgi:Uncharacterised nucleotidyltransferase